MFNGNSVYDQCGLCGGDGTTCLDCLGQPNGTAHPDACGICNGDGSSCAGTVLVLGHHHHYYYYYYYYRLPWRAQRSWKDGAVRDMRWGWDDLLQPCQGHR